MVLFLYQFVLLTRLSVLLSVTVQNIKAVGSCCVKPQQRKKALSGRLQAPPGRMKGAAALFWDCVLAAPVSVQCSHCPRIRPSTSSYSKNTAWQCNAPQAFQFRPCSLTFLAPWGDSPSSAAVMVLALHCSQGMEPLLCPCSLWIPSTLRPARPAASDALA